MSETARFFLLQTTLIAVVLVMHTYIGLHIIRRTLIFSDLVLDQLAAFGALIGVGLGVRYGSAGSYVSAMAVVLVGAGLLSLIKPTGRAIPREAVIGILYVLALALTLLLGDKLQGGASYVTKALSGAMLWVSRPLVVVTVVVYIGLMIFHYRFRSSFIALAQEPEKLKNEKLWDFLLFTTQGIITVLIVPIAGVLLAYAFLMIPAAIAAMFTTKWAPAVILGWSMGFVACMIGLSSSYLFNLPYSPSIILSLGAFFVFAVALRCLLSRNGAPAAGGR